jgi:membrane protein
MLSGLAPRIKSHNLTLVAAGVAFYAFLALVPALVAFISVYGLVANPEDVTRQVQDIASALPKEVQDFLVFQLTSIANANRAGVSVTLVIAIVLALWSASGGMAAMITGIHVANGQEQVGGFVAKRGKALGLTIVAMLFLGVVIFMIAAVPALLDKAGLGTAGKLVFSTLRWPLLAALMICGVALLYKVALTEGSGGWLGFISPGAVVATLGWLVVSAGFAFYASHFSSYSKTYGALASIVVVLLWLWLSTLVVLMGSEVDGLRSDQPSTSSIAAGNELTE